MLTYPASIPLSTRSLTLMTTLIRDRRRALGTRWRRLPAQQQALMALAHLRNGDTLTRLAAGFKVSVATVWRYLREAVDLLAGADDLAAVMRRAARLAYAILDGTLIPIDRVADQRPYYSGKHKRHGVNVQVLTDAAGRLVWASAALPRPVPRPHRRPHPRLDRRVDQSKRADLRGQGLSGSRRERAHAVQAPPIPTETVPPPAGRQP